MLKACELWHGLPESVADLATLIYGAADDPENAVKCQFDSAAGLGAAFSNPRGAHMGCVLSPDKAKVWVNSIIVAIHASVKGVKMYGWGDEESAETWREAKQARYGDDW